MDIKKEKEFYGQADEDAKSGSGFVAMALRWIAFGVLGFVFGRASLPFGATPFGIALICSVKSCTLPALIGVLLSALGSARAPIYVAACSATAVMRCISCAFLEIPSARRKNKGERLTFLLNNFFGEPTVLCALVSATGVFLFSLYYVIRGGFLLYDVYSAIIGTVAAALSVLLMRRFLVEREARFPLIFSGEEIDSKKLGVTDILSLVALSLLCVVTVLGADGLVPFGVSLSALLAMGFVFATTKYRSLSSGALIGALCGLAVDPLLAPSFVFGSVIFAFLSPISVFLGTLGAFAVAMWWGFYSLGISVLTSLLPALLTASLLFTVVDALIAGVRKDQAAEDTLLTENSERRAARDRFPSEMLSFQGRAAQRSLKKLGAGLGALSDELYSISALYAEELRDGRDIYGICEGAFDSACSSCKQREECRAECEFSEELGVIGGELRREGHAQSASVSEKLRNRCARLPDILDEINYNAALRGAVGRDLERTESFALDYKTLSSLVSVCAARIDDENEIDAALGVLLSRRIFDDTRLECAAAVFGKRQKRAVLSFDMSQEGLPEDKESLAELLRPAVSAVCGVKMTLIESNVSESAITLVYGRGAVISVSFDGRSANAFGEDEYCGDSYGVHDDEDSHRVLAFISDGMGCGREASEVSRTVAVFLKNLLPVSYDCEQTVNMLNSFLRRRGSNSLTECSATVDLAEIDLISSHAVFYKSGAAPTYVLRGDSVFKIRARTIPVGIINEVDIKRIDLDLYPNDIIVMVSDGVTQSKEECPRLFELLKSTRSTDPKRISELVLKYAVDAGGKDDISVLTLRIDESQS